MDLEAAELEIVWLEVRCPGDTLLVGCGYRPPDKPVPYWDSLQENIETAMEGPQASTVLTGDFNIDYSCENSPNAQHLHRVLSCSNLRNYVTSPTRVTSHTASTIDLFLSNTPISGACETIYGDISDHFAILAHLPVNQTGVNRTSQPGQSRRIHTIDWEKFQTDLCVHFHQFPRNGTINDMTGAFTSAIMETLDEHAPLVARRKRGRRICPWLTEELVSAVRHRNRLHHRLMKDQANEVLREQHRLARAFARKLDRKLRNLYFVNQCNTPDQQKLWSAMNAVTGRRKERQIPQVSVEDLGQVFGEIVYDPSRPQNLHPPLGPIASQQSSRLQTCKCCRC